MEAVKCSECKYNNESKCQKFGFFIGEDAVLAWCKSGEEKDDGQ